MVGCGKVFVAWVLSEGFKSKATFDDMILHFFTPPGALNFPGPFGNSRIRSFDDSLGEKSVGDVRISGWVSFPFLKRRVQRVLEQLPVSFLVSVGCAFEGFGARPSVNRDDDRKVVGANGRVDFPCKMFFPRRWDQRNIGG